MQKAQKTGKFPIPWSQELAHLSVAYIFKVYYTFRLAWFGTEFPHLTYGF